LSSGDRGEKGRPEGGVRAAEVLKRMADALKSGAVMLDLQCPACSSPLFRLRSGEIWCVRCQKRVVVVREGEDAITAMSDLLLASLEETLLRKLQELNAALKNEEDLDRLVELTKLMSGLLDNLEKVRRISRRRR